MNIYTFLEPIIIPLGRFLWKHQMRREERNLQWSLRHPEVSDERVIERLFYGIPYQYAKYLYEDGKKYGNRMLYFREHQDWRVVYFYRMMYIFSIYLKTRAP